MEENIQESINFTVLEKLGTLQFEEVFEENNLYVDDYIIFDEGCITDMDYHHYWIQVHAIDFLEDNNDSDVQIRFAINSNPFTMSEVPTLEDMIIELFMGYDLKRKRTIKHLEDLEEAEEGLEDAGAICYVYEMKMPSPL